MGELTGKAQATPIFKIYDTRSCSALLGYDKCNGPSLNMSDFYPTTFCACFEQDFGYSLDSIQCNPTPMNPTKKYII